jgi:hypothetical protein
MDSSNFKYFLIFWPGAHGKFLTKLDRADLGFPVTSWSLDAPGVARAPGGS